MKILILGASGMLGHDIFTYLKDCGLDVVGTYYSHSTVDYLEQTDATNLGRIQRLLNRVNPDVIVNTIGNPNPDWCETNKDLALDVNTFTARNIAFACYPKKLIFISTDYVFDGENNPYKENDLPCPINYYGLTKLLAESYTKRLAKDPIILRLPLLYDKKYILELLKKIKERNLKVDCTLIKHPTWVGDVSRAIKFLIDRDTNGIFHLGNTERLTRYEWSLRIAQFFNLPSDSIIKTNPSYIAKRPLNVELDVSKIGINCRETDKILREYF